MSSLSFPDSQKTWLQTPQGPGTASLPIRFPSCSASLSVGLRSRSVPQQSLLFLPQAVPLLGSVLTSSFPCSPVCHVSSKHLPVSLPVLPRSSLPSLPGSCGIFSPLLPPSPPHFPSACWSLLEASSLPLSFPLPKSKKDFSVEEWKGPCASLAWPE